jgi:hypothetical protein
LLAGSLLLAAEVAPRVRVSTPVGEVTWVLWLFLSVGGSRLHRLSRVLSLLLPLPVGGHNALWTLSKREVGRLISVRRELTLSERGNLGGHVDCCACFGVIVVLVGFSLETVVRIVIPMVGYDQNGLTCSEQASRRVMRNSESIPPLWLLASLRHSCPILGVPEHPRGAGGVVICCFSFDLNLI